MHDTFWCAGGAGVNDCGVVGAGVGIGVAPSQPSINRNGALSSCRASHHVLEGGNATTVGELCTFGVVDK